MFYLNYFRLSSIDFNISQLSDIGHNMKIMIGLSIFSLCLAILMHVQGGVMLVNETD